MRVLLDAGRPYLEVAQELGRTVGAVMARAQGCNVAKRTTARDVMELLTTGGRHSVNEMVDCFGRTRSAVRYSCIRLRNSGKIQSEIVGNQVRYFV